MDQSESRERQEISQNHGHQESKIFIFANSDNNLFRDCSIGRRVAQPTKGTPETVTGNQLSIKMSSSLI